MVRKGVARSKVGMKVMMTEFGRFVASGLLKKTGSKLMERSIPRRGVSMT